MCKKLKLFVFGFLMSASFCLGSRVSFAQSKDEYLENFLNNVYTIMLERASDEEGVSYWIEKILNEEIGILDFLNQILDQDEFKNLNTTPEDFVTKTYNLLMNREPDEEGFNFWVDELKKSNDSTGKLNLINEMAHSEEFLNNINELEIIFKKEPVIEQQVVEDENENDLDVFVKDAYRHILNREIDNDGFIYWKSQLESKEKGALDLINEFIKLDEFKSRNLNDEQFIGAMYEVLFNRSADDEGLKYWNNIYSKDKSAKRMQNIVFNIADDKEFLQRVKSMNIILKKVDQELFYSEYLNYKNNIRGINSSQLNEITKGMSFFDIIVKLGRTRNVSSVKGINIAKYIVDGAKPMYFIFSNPSSTYNFNAIDVFKAQK